MFEYHFCFLIKTSVSVTFFLCCSSNEQWDFYFILKSSSSSLSSVSVSNKCFLSLTLNRLALSANSFMWEYSLNYGSERCGVKRVLWGNWQIGLTQKKEKGLLWRLKRLLTEFITWKRVKKGGFIRMSIWYFLCFLLPIQISLKMNEKIFPR
jgi:hypothetical protein